MKQGFTYLNIFCCLAMCFAFTGISAQKKVKFTVSGGVSINRLNFEINDDIEPRSGIHGGVDFSIGESGYLLFGAHYQEFTQNILFTDSITTDKPIVIDEEIQLKGLRCPVQLGFYFYNERQIKVFGAVGLNFNVHLGTVGQSVPIPKDLFTKFYTGGELAVGVDLWRFSLLASYELGVTPMFEDNARSQNNVLRLGLGLNF